MTAKELIKRIRDDWREDLLWMGADDVQHAKYAAAFMLGVVAALLAVALVSQ